MNNKYNSFELKSKAKYKDVTNVSFTPVREIAFTKKYKKGDKLYWKWFGFIPLIPYKAKNDLYSSYRWDGLKTLDEIIEDDYYLFVDKDKFFNKSKVSVQFKNGSYDCQFFTSNEKALEYIDDLKKTCKEVGNELK